MSKSIAIRIRQARVAASLTQTQLARVVGVNRSAVAQWEREQGGTHPSVSNLSAIALATRASFEWLATGRGLSECTTQIEPLSVAVYASDELEARYLQIVRLLPKRTRAAVCHLLEELAR